MKNSMKFILVCVCVLPLFAFAKDATWQESMKSLSNSLTDVFPFLYSRSEFHDPKNKPVLLKNFERLNSVAHKLPASAGKGFIGSEPLFNEIKISVKNDLTKAQEFLRADKFDLAQKFGQSAVQKCFGCHTAIQVGPSFPQTNSEVMNMATPFARGKIAAFGALRQFRGALDIIERDVRQLKDNTQKLEFAKLYMVVSLRALQDYAGAQKFLDSLVKSNNGNKELDAIFSQWKSDIKNWLEQPTKMNDIPSGNADSKFVTNLHNSFILHNQTAVVSANERAKIFNQLGKIYQQLNLAEFSDLPRIYFMACMKENASTKEPCEKNL